MNRNYMLWHLHEAREQLEEIITDLGSNPDYGEPELLVTMGHLYHHLNSAWNSRKERTEVTKECSEEKFYSWRRFPENEEFLFHRADGSF